MLLFHRATERCHYTCPSQPKYREPRGTRNSYRGVPRTSCLWPRNLRRRGIRVVDREVRQPVRDRRAAALLHQSANHLLSGVEHAVALSVFRRRPADELAVEARCFGLREERTYLRKMNFSKNGWGFVAIWLVALIGYVVLTKGNLYGIIDTNPLIPLVE